MEVYYFEISEKCLLRVKGREFWHCLEKTKSFIDCSGCKFYTKKPKGYYVVLDIN